jgi:hypothetical protein
VTETVTPVMVEGTTIAHLATTVLDYDGTGYRAICPMGPRITRGLRLIAADETFVWCGDCQAWASAAGLTLPG